MKNKKLSYIDAAKYSTTIFVLLLVLVWVSFYFGSSAYFPTGERPDFGKDFNEKLIVFGIAGTYLFLFVLFALNFKIFESRLREPKKFYVAILSSIATVVVFNFILALFFETFIKNDHIPHGARIGMLIRDLAFALGVFFMSLIVYLSNQKQRMILEFEAMKAENAHSRFESLKNQLDPHFLFNTFNTLDSFIQEDPRKARNYLQQLSSVFRYVIANKDLVTLDEELEFTRSYNELMLLRYENSLKFEFSIDENYLRYQIVPLSLQALIENAIKHNVISSEAPLIIRVSVGPEPLVKVWNEIKPKKTSQAGSGIGLSNLTERFRLKLQKEIEISDKDNVFSVILPLHKPAEILP